MTGLGVRGVASQSLPSVRQLSGAATGVFSGEGKGGTGGGLTVFVGVGAGFSIGLGLDGGFVGLGEVGVTGASGAGGLETLQPMFFLGQPASVSDRCLLACDRGASCGVSRLCCRVARRSYAARNTKAGN